MIDGGDDDNDDDRRGIVGIVDVENDPLTYCDDTFDDEIADGIGMYPYK